MENPAVRKGFVREHIASGRVIPAVDSPAGVEIRIFASEACGANAVSTGTATFVPSAELPFHTYERSQVITLLQGLGQVSVEDRQYLLSLYDSIHIPAGVPHSLTNACADAQLVVHWALADACPARSHAERPGKMSARGFNGPQTGDPESIVRFERAEKYELSPGALFRDLFAARLGSVGICGGYGRFQPGSSLPCHVHNYDESITIVEGVATCLVQGNRYSLSGFDTAFVPEGRPHRFINHTGQPMAMIWVYAGSEPERTLVDAGYCDGASPWPGIMRP